MDFLESLTPRERVLRTHRDGVRRMAGIAIPLFGLPSGWAGMRSTGNTEFQTGVTRDRDGVHGEMHETVELLHASGSSTLSAQSSDVASPIGAADMRTLLGAPGTEEELDVDLDGERVVFAAAFATELWVARWVGYEVTVTLRGHRWPVTTGLQLVRITDLRPYHEGRLRMLQRRSGLDLDG